MHPYLDVMVWTKSQQTHVFYTESYFSFKEKESISYFEWYKNIYTKSIAHLFLVSV